MTTAASPESRWWWFDPAHKAGSVKPEAATWELIRRADFYRHLWGEHVHTYRVLAENLAGKPKPLIQLARRRHFFGVLKDVAGRFHELLWQECDPAKSWIELTAAQRRTVASVRRWLPREGPPAAQAFMGVGLCRVERDGQGRLTVTDYFWGGDVVRIAEVDQLPDFQSIPIHGPTVFFTITFDPRLGRKALAAQLDERLTQRLAPPERAALSDGELRHFAETGQAPAPDPTYTENCRRFLELAQKGDWATISANRSVYPKLWKPDSTVGRSHSVDPLTRIIPEHMGPHYVCLIPATCDVATVRERFHNLLRRDGRRRWERRCKRITDKMPEWQKQKARHLPLPIKRADVRGVWFGLAAYDCASLSKSDPQAESIFREWLELTGSDKSQPHGFRMRKAREAVWNFRRAVEARLDELNRSPLAKMAARLRAQSSLPYFPLPNSPA